MADEELTGRGMATAKRGEMGEARDKWGDAGDPEDLLIGTYVVLDLRKLDRGFDSVDALLL